MTTGVTSAGHAGHENWPALLFTKQKAQNAVALKLTSPA